MEKADVFFTLTASVGGLITCLSVLWLQRNSKLEKEGITAEGLIVQVDYEGLSSPAYYATVCFQTLQQEWITVRSRHGTKFPIFKEGETVRVRFDPMDPTNFSIKGEGSSTNAWLMAFSGITIIVCAIVNYLRA